MPTTSSCVLKQCCQAPYTEESYSAVDDIELLSGDKDVGDLRDLYAADLVQLIGVYTDFCGYGWVADYKQRQMLARGDPPFRSFLGKTEHPTTHSRTPLRFRPSPDTTTMALTNLASAWRARTASTATSTPTS